MSSATSTERAQRSPWQFYILLAMAGATVAVMVSRETHPAALMLLSAAVVAAGAVGAAIHGALVGFFSRDRMAAHAPLSERTRDALQREKALVLRSIKELEFDHGMGKISDADFQEIGSRLRARALALMQELETSPLPSATSPASKTTAARTVCGRCGTANDADARFCKLCGAALAR